MVVSGQWVDADINKELELAWETNHRSARIYPRPNGQERGPAYIVEFGANGENGVQYLESNPTLRRRVRRRLVAAPIEQAPLDYEPNEEPEPESDRQDGTCADSERPAPNAWVSDSTRPPDGLEPEPEPQ